MELHILLGQQLQVANLRPYPSHTLSKEEESAWHYGITSTYHAKMQCLGSADKYFRIDDLIKKTFIKEIRVYQKYLHIYFTKILK